MICEATVFLLFSLHLDSQSFKIVKKNYLPHPAFSFLAGGGDVAKKTLKLLFILYLAVFNSLSIIIADQNNLFHGQVGSVIGQISI